jgi:tRNA threonylcarbamoyladenosine biosynthesis protein TsaE
MQTISSGPEQTQNIAEKLAKELKGVIALTGDLGAGKTTFTQGFAKGLGIKEKIISPTFVLMRIHKIPKSKKVLYHIDLYRLEDNQFENLGLEEIINDPKNIVLIEWAEKAKKLLPRNTTWIQFEVEGDSRRISISRGPTL